MRQFLFPAPETVFASDSAPELSIIIPTLNEAENIVALLRRIAAAMPRPDWEVVVVDDASPDGTAALVHAHAAEEPRVRCLERHGKRGLSSACLDGMAAARGRYLAVLDADLQHDESLLPEMLDRLRTGEVDVVVGSRYMDGGGVGSWNAARHGASRCATALAQWLLAPGLHDPMSGFFMMRAECMRAVRPRLCGLGFKLLLDLIAASPQPLRLVEVPYRFGCRTGGRSKLGVRVALAFLYQLAARSLAQPRLREATAFALVGGAGVITHLACLALLLRLLPLPFAAAQTIAVFVAMMGNFVLNNRFTFRQRQLRGLEALHGLLSFSVLCSAGAIGNVIVAAAVDAAYPHRWVAALAGIVVGATWNFGCGVAIVWPEPDSPDAASQPSAASLGRMA
jgi:dolichol-phosphate mannosyltransferase